MAVELKPCPFCGWHMDGDQLDIVYPTGSYAHYIDPQHPESGLHFNLDRRGAVHEVWHVGCTENMGGCGASVLGLDKEGAVAAWNRRTDVSGVMVDATYQRPDFRKCEFCGCNTNAAVRACCNKGRDADRNAGVGIPVGGQQK